MSTATLFLRTGGCERIARSASMTLLAMLVACCGSGAESDANVVAQRDSAGVRIVTLGDVYAATLPEWAIEERLSIGEDASRSHQHQLHDVTAATALHDGTIAVANGGSGEIRVFDRSARHLRTFGREGEGPGEFENLSWLARALGDTLVSFDNDLRRATWFTYDGEVVGTLTVQPDLADPTNATPFGTTWVEAVGVDRGGLLVRAGYLRRSGQGEYRDMFTLYTVDARGALVDSLASYPGQELYFVGQLPGPILASPPVFGRRTRVAAAAGRVVAGSTERFELHVYEDAALQAKIVAGVLLAPVTETEIEAWLDVPRARASEASGPAAQVMQALIENAPVRETPPAFERLAIDTQHLIWIEEPYRMPEGPSRWLVLSADGIPKARVEFPLRGPTPATPPDLKILEIGEDYVLAVRRDELEVEAVVLYNLERER